jgi:predicted phosphodiesterase
MRIRVLSDLHIEFAPFSAPPVDADVVVLAGDIHTGTRGVRWAAESFPNQLVVYVPGNHEYYGHSIPRLATKLRELGQSLGIHVLDRESITIHDVTFLGATLWTDFNLSPNRQLAMQTAAMQMADYKRIRVDPEYRRLRPADTGAMHWMSLNWLKHKLAATAGRTVVVTHHAPSQKSLNPRNSDQWIEGAYASPLDEFVSERNPTLWIHGHTHHAAGYQLGRTRVISNQRGYPDCPVAGFDPTMVIEI